MGDKTKPKKCPSCHAEYAPDTKWCYGYYEGTSTQFVKLGNVEEGVCPVCRKKEADYDR